MTVKPTTEIVVPWSVLRRVGLKAGDRVDITARPGLITIRKAPAARGRTKTEQTKKQRQTS